MTKINILYTVDHNYAKYMVISLLSLLENNKCFNRINVHIIYDDLHEEDFKRINYIANMFDNCNIFFYDYNIFLKNNTDTSIPKWRGSNIANARLFFKNFIKDVDNLLYLDSDTLIVDKLNNLQETNKPVSAILDHLSKKYWSNLDPTLTQYYNSGVLWINSHEWDNKNCDEKIKNVVDKKIHLTYPDQDILNIALKNEFSTIPLNYNIFPVEFYYDLNTLMRFYKINEIDFYSKEEVKDAKNNPIILHLLDINDIRPWHSNNHHPFNKEFDKYYNQLYSTIPKETIYTNQNKYLNKIMDYLRVYVPKEIKKIIRKK